MSRALDRFAEPSIPWLLAWVLVAAFLYDLYQIVWTLVTAATTRTWPVVFTLLSLAALAFGYRRAHRGGPVRSV